MNSSYDLKPLDMGSKWSKAYWFARMLINTDKYGGVGSDSRLISELASALRIVDFQGRSLNETDIVKIQKEKMKRILFKRFSKAKSRLTRIQKLWDDLDEEITNSFDIRIFMLTCECIMLPLNQAIANIPSSDIEYAQTVAKAYLNTQGEKGLATVINLWDDVGIRGCLTAERTEIVRAFGALRLALSNENALSEVDRDTVLTAFVQEFERRAGQKRKGRAGGSLENVASFILDYFNIDATHPPEHFEADIEIDKWIKTKDGWIIGISCKRTLRERWKQVSSADSNTLSKFRIKYLYHLITYDEDLSDEKIALLGGRRHVFCLRDDSRRFLHASKHIGLTDYVRPMTMFIKDLKREQGRKSV
jgi:hypothetical protein